MRPSTALVEALLYLYLAVAAFVRAISGEGSKDPRGPRRLTHAVGGSPLFSTPRGPSSQEKKAPKLGRSAHARYNFPRPT